MRDSITHRATKPGVVEVPDFFRTDLRTWERDAASGRFKVGIWRRDDRLDRWFSLAPLPLPWRHREAVPLCFLNPDGRSVIITGGVQLDDRPWLHLSVARQNRMPSYKDLAEVKDLFIGASRQAIQIFPPDTNHVNLHKFCLHLWHCLEDDGLPDFTGGGASI